MFQRALAMYDPDTVKSRVRASFTTIKNRTLQRFGYELDVSQEPFLSYYTAVVGLIEVLTSVKASTKSLRVAITETTKVSQNVSDALHAVCEHDSAATFEAYAFKVAVAGSWDQALEHDLGELTRSADARLAQFTELKKRLQEREARKTELDAERQSLHNMHLKALPVDIVAKAEHKVAELSRALSQLNGSLVLELADIYKERFQIMSSFVVQLQQLQLRYSQHMATALASAITSTERAAVVTDDAPQDVEEDAAAAGPGAGAGSAGAAEAGDADEAPAEAGSPSAPPDDALGPHEPVDVLGAADES